MSNRNNVNLDAVTRTAQAIQQDPGKGKKTNRVEGAWNLGAGPQFSAEIAFEGGTMLVEADQPSAQGGSGARPGPIHYCLFGLASCFAATFATVAASEGVDLEELRIAVESDMNMARGFALSDAPAVEETRVTITVRAEAPREAVERVARLAEERCPAVFCLTNPVKLVSAVVTPEAATA